MGLVLSRKEGEGFVLIQNNQIIARITIIQTPCEMKLHIDALKDIRILRENRSNEKVDFNNTLLDKFENHN